MPDADYLGAIRPTLMLYLPHRPNGLVRLQQRPDAAELLAANSNHWRKIVNLLAKVVSPSAEDWRLFRDVSLFQNTALGFAPALSSGGGWHWIGGKENLQRFVGLKHNACPLVGAPGVSVDTERRLLLTPYPDYRQLSNALVETVRRFLEEQGFYGGTHP
ncbi:MAG: DUF6942 family protein [Alcanivorax sp.]|uniref:DUF6942 family protein n=1 Tax=Alcanivorax sp. TaxID=1872427 RepID=UPI003DA6F788